MFDVLSGWAPDAAMLHDGRRSWSAAEVNAESETLASLLAGCCVLAVLADNSPAWAMADIAALRAGVAHLPLPAFFTGSQIVFALEQTGADVLLTDQPERIGSLDLGFVMDGAWQGLTVMRRAVARVAIPEGTAKISFTSGSTGRPKGVCLSAEGLGDTAHALRDRLADLSIEKHLAVLPLALLLENVAGVYAPLARGTPIYLPPLGSLGWRGAAGFDPAALHAAVETAQPSSAILVPELLKGWALYLAATGKRAPASLRYVAVGGARVDPALMERARGLGLPAYQGYGLTECGSVVCVNRPGDDGEDVGRPLAHVRMRIEDGEVFIRARAFLGYLGAGRAGDRREFATGDLGEFDAQGHLKLLGRRKNVLINSYGRNISPEWVESVLLAQPAISQAVAIGEAQPFLCALLTPALGAEAGDIALAVETANALLPDYARIGRWISAPPFHAQNGLATGNGRPIRAAILERFAGDIAALYEDESRHDIFP